jgi:hypothetical protein
MFNEAAVLTCLNVIPWHISFFFALLSSSDIFWSAEFELYGVQNDE